MSSLVFLLLLWLLTVPAAVNASCIWIKAVNIWKGCNHVKISTVNKFVSTHLTKISFYCALKKTFLYSAVLFSAHICSNRNLHFFYFFLFGHKACHLSWQRNWRWHCCVHLCVCACARVCVCVCVCVCVIMAKTLLCRTINSIFKTTESRVFISILHCSARFSGHYTWTEIFIIIIIISILPFSLFQRRENTAVNCDDDSIHV